MSTVSFAFARTFCVPSLLPCSWLEWARVHPLRNPVVRAPEPMTRTWVVWTIWGCQTPPRETELWARE